MPSTNSSVVSVVLPSSTVITPSLPTFSMASASRSPIVVVVVGADRADLGDLFLARDRLGHLVAAARSRLRRPCRCRGGRPSGCCRRRCCGGLPEDRAGQDGGGGGAVAGDVGGLRGDFVDELGAHVLERVFELDFLGDGDAVLGDGRAAERLVDDHVAAGRAERDGDGVGQLSTPCEHLARGRRSSKSSCFSHGDDSSSEWLVSSVVSRSWHGVLPMLASDRDSLRALTRRPSPGCRTRGGS